MDCAKYFLSEAKPKINAKNLKSIIKQALIEDTGKGDITTELTLPKNKKIRAQIIAKENFLLCGIDVAKEIFKTVDPGLSFLQKAQEGNPVHNQQVIAVISGKASSILKGERVALNLLSLLSGVATKTRRFVRAIGALETKITDTRKTIAGLRELQKYAVRIGGGYNHRISLDEMLLVKDNHLKILGGYTKLPDAPSGYKIELETQSLQEFRHALSLNPDIIMLDNMKIKDIKKAVKIRNDAYPKNKKPLLEASGDMHLGNIKKYAACGVDIISIGELTDSVKSVDISLEVNG
ncbi:MAG: nicotinate-nucleotide diphosphorylase (carboxylating) [Candidatus Omnitrophica bacterium CG11_big_fil_rev_8_21_14_0_20_41_12]|nr:MAG: nicotinate-nucleotide diphosphorylase (carboxylating) [Candidatus Omnitrophica bacterium CG11_big_fil_rev_8_21_14_0_20_41_12]